MSTLNARERGGALKKFIVAIAVLVVVVVVAAGLLLPSVISWFLTREVKVDLASGPGTLRIRDAGISWTGPQRLGKVTLDDSSGRSMADAKIEADSSIFALAMGALGGGDLGTVSISGTLDILEEQLIAAPGTGAPSQTPPPTSGTAGSGSSGPLRLPPALRASLKASPLRIKYTPRAGSGLQPVQIDDLSALATLSGTGQADLSIQSSSPSIDIKGAMRNFVGAGGVVDLAASEIDLAAAISAPGELIEGLVRAALSQPSAGGAPTTTASAGVAPTKIALGLTARGGRLKLTDPAKPIVIEGPVPQALIEMLAGEGAKISIDSAPMLRKNIAGLDVPLPGPSGAIDLRGAAFRVNLTTTVISGTVTTAGADARAFKVEPFQLNIESPDLAQVVTIAGGTRGTLDGRDAGTLSINAEAQGLLDAAGAPRSGLPAKIRGEIDIAGVPTTLADPFVKDLGLKLTELIGPTITTKLTALTRESDGSTPAGAIPPTEISLNLSADHLRVRAQLLADQTMIRAQGEGIHLWMNRAVAAATPFIADSGLALSGSGVVVLSTKDLTVPLVSGMLPDLNRARADIELSLSELTVEQGVGDRPLAVRDAKARLVIAPDESPRVALNSTLDSAGRPIVAAGSLELAGLITKRDGEWPFLDVTPRNLRPKGELEVTGIPSDLLGYVPQELREAARRSIGQDLTVRLTGAAESAEVTVLTLNLSAEGLDGEGQFALERTALRSTGPGVVVTLSDPGPLIEQYSRMQEDSPVESIWWRSPVRLELSGLNAPIPSGSSAYPVERIEADARVQTGGLSIAMRSPTGSKQITVDELEISASQRAEAGASMTLNSGGAFSGERFTLTGNLGLGKILGPSGLNVGALAPRGTIEAQGLPTSIVSVFDPKNGGLAEEAIGPRLDMTLTAPANASGEDAAAGERSVSLTVRGAAMNARTTASLNDKTINVGQSNFELTITPALVERAMGIYAADMTPRPALAGPTTLKAVLYPTAIDLDAQSKPDTSTLRPLRGMVTSEGDLVLLNLPGGAEGKPLSAGLRSIELGATYVARSMTQSEGSVKAKLFDPAEPGSTVADVDVLTSLINPPPNFQGALKNIDTVRLERMLGRAGLVSDLAGPAMTVGVTGRVPRPGAAQQLDLVVDSERLQTTLTLERSRDAIVLSAPGTLDVEAPAAWANRYLAAPGAQGEPAAAQFTAPVRLKARLDRLAIAMAENTGPLKPGVFALGAAIDVPSIAVRTQDGQAVTVQDLKSTLRSDGSGETLSFELETPQIAVAGAGESRAIKATGSLKGFADAAGNFSAERAVLDSRVTGSLPTALLDALGAQKGLLVDLLGKNTSLAFESDNLSKTTGTVSAKVDTDNANASIRGRVDTGTFYAEPKARISLMKITPELSARYFETVIPIISRLEKSTDDQPSVIDATGLTLPLDGDTRKINGQFNVDLGTVSFDTSDFFGQLVKVIGGKESGKIGQRIKPFEMQAVNGVVSYEQIELPLGEFQIQTRGSVDLNTRTMDIVTFVPFYAVADEIAGGLSKIPGLSKLTQIPIRTHGSFDRPKSDVQLDLLVSESVPSVIEEVLPDEIKKALPEGVGDAIKDLFKKKKNN